MRTVPPRTFHVPVNLGLHGRRSGSLPGATVLDPQESRGQSAVPTYDCGHSSMFAPTCRNRGTAIVHSAKN